jgi:hypothetical protein
MQELDSVVLAVDRPEWGLVAGDVGTIVHVYGEGEAYEVEFTTVPKNMDKYSMTSAEQFC